jgi:hypothetical protein
MSEPETLTLENAAELLRRQDALQTEARAVLEDLGIVRLLSQLGNPVQLGSSALGLMVWPDIDITVSCPGLTIERTLETMRLIYAHPRVKRVRYSNEVGSFNPTGLELDDRYYFAVYYHASTGTEWKIDISFWPGTVEHPEPVHEAVARKLTEETRLSILWIKDVWYHLPTYRYQVYSVDIYNAVLEHGVRTPAEFDVYLADRGKPAR